MILDLLPTSSEAIGKGRPLKLGTKNGKSVSTGLTLMTLNLQTLLENIILWHSRITLAHDPILTFYFGTRSTRSGSIKYTSVTL